MLVGFAIGMTRTVVPALAESEFGLERGSFLLLASFVVAFGAVKAVMNFVAGRWSERIGRKRVLRISRSWAPQSSYDHLKWSEAACVLSLQSLGPPNIWR
jgi:MFS family permease